MSKTPTTIIDDDQLSGATKALHKIQEMKQPSIINDFAFLTTHTITCFLTDFLTIPGSSWLSEHTAFGWKEGTFNYKIDFKDKIKTDAGEKKGAGLEEWTLGEIVGDIAAIPVTIGLQRLFPEAAGWIGKPLEAVFGGYYRNSAEKAADAWAEKFNIEKGSKEHYAYKEAHYEKEIAHLPQIALWTVTSMIGNAVAQKVIAPEINSDWGSIDSYSDIMVNNIGGKVITALAANIPRLIAPHSVDHLEHELGEFINRRITPDKQSLSEISNDGVLAEKAKLSLRV